MSDNKIHIIPPARPCARCGQDTRRAAGEAAAWQPNEYDNQLSGHFSFSGAYGSYRYDYQLWAAELCESCCEQLRSWINHGVGPGLVVIDNVMDDYQQFCQERGLVEDDTIPLIPPDRADWEQWLTTKYDIQLP